MKEHQQMYLQNKYTQWYYNIIQRAQTRTISGYVEKHHIIPKSLNGSNKKENLVFLTAKEHFICHLLLTRMLVGDNRNKMVYAVWQMANQKNSHQFDRKSVTGKTYEILKKEFSVIHSKRMKENHHFNNPAIREKHRLSLIERGPTSTKGIKRSEETKEKLRNKVWTEKAVASRLVNCLNSAAKRKGVKNPAHGKKIFELYVFKNKDLIQKIWELFNTGNNRRQIAFHLGVSWDRVNVAINRKIDIQLVLTKVTDI